VSDRLVDVRTPLAVSETVRIELGADGTMHVVTPSVTLHLDRERCEELATTLARSMLRLRKLDRARARPILRVVAVDGAARSQDEPRGA
jgi:hypothetical protein